MIILIFLDFLETTCYLIEKNSLSETDIYELFGTSLNYYFGVFEEYIVNRREKYGDNYCKEFENHVRKCKKLAEKE